MDHTDIVFSKLLANREESLNSKFHGAYRALIVETNDPLNIGRVRIKCPELHDFSVNTEDCPWAVPSPDLGGKRAGRFVTPVIGDIVFIQFEKNHPYAPMYIGFAAPTRRKYYSFPQISNISPIAVNENGEILSRPKDFDINYLPNDGRPMAHGWVDRYGNMDIHSSVGYFPSEHAQAPPPPDHDAIQGSVFQQQSNAPAVNSPDKKYMARITKYGNIFLQSDQGYHWKKENDIGEFTGDAEKDEKFETKRYLYLQKLLNDNVPRAGLPNGDQRKTMIMNRYGSRIEIRDTGWAQQGPIASKSRDNEFGPRQTLSNESIADYRWIKLRTKGGILLQAYDKGTHPDEDKFVKRPLLQESGHQSEHEDKHWGGTKDARWFRICTRHGYKLVLDDRGADERDSSNKETPRGVGIMLKGRRTPAANAREAHGDPRGFLFEFNENDKANHATWASPMGQIMEINDRYQYMMIASSLGKGWVPKFRGLKENEFIRKPSAIRNPEKNSHHLKLDHANEYIRFKTRGNNGTRPEGVVNQSGVGSSELQQGLEARDGSNGDGPWVEVVDCQNRGLWFSKQNQIGIWRSKKGRRMYQWMDDLNRRIVIFNNEANGTIDIYASRSVNVISDQDINIRADRHVFIKAGSSIRMQAGGTKFSILQNILTNTTINAAKVNAFICGVRAGTGAGCANASGVQVDRIARPVLPTTIEPKDRGQTYNGPFEECPVEEVEHEIRP